MFNDDLRAITQKYLGLYSVCRAEWIGLIAGLLYLSEELETGYLSIQSSPLALSKQVNTKTLQLRILVFAQACQQDTCAVLTC